MSYPAVSDSFYTLTERIDRRLALLNLYRPKVFVLLGEGHSRRFLSSTGRPNERLVTRRKMGGIPDIARTKS
jgi:hypothetical protein